MYTLENENEHRINFLDITIHNKDNKLLFSIYRKPTATDVIIPTDSCHPPEHKYAAIRCMTDRLHKYRLNDKAKRTEQQIVEQIITNNGYETSTLKQPNKLRHMNSTTNTKTQGPNSLILGEKHKPSPNFLKKHN
jgi:hypothetical protein